MIEILNILKLRLLQVNIFIYFYTSLAYSYSNIKPYSRKFEDSIQV
jgi:hypothetical protein